MAEHCGQLPLGGLLAYAHTHVVFNQDNLLQSFIQQKAYHLQFEEEREVENTDCPRALRFARSARGQLQFEEEGEVEKH